MQGGRRLKNSHSVISLKLFSGFPNVFHLTGFLTYRSDTWLYWYLYVLFRVMWTFFSPETSNCANQQPRLLLHIKSSIYDLFTTKIPEHWSLMWKTSLDSVMSTFPHIDWMRAAVDLVFFRLVVSRIKYNCHYPWILDQYQPSKMYCIIK